ncbi:hypothetical protein ES703_89821 [subsurface metagenome]
MAGPLRSNHHNINILRRYNVLKVNIKAVTKTECLPGDQIWLNQLLVNFCLHLVRHRDNNQSRAGHSGLYITRCKAVLKRKFKIIRPLKLRHRNFNTAVPQIQTVRVALTAVADNRHLLTL